MSQAREGDPRAVADDWQEGKRHTNIVVTD
jgi:hypothetical protein